MAVQSMGAPYLILCSENDDLAPVQTICNFTQRLKDLGGDVKLVKWSSSSHVGRLLNHYFILFLLLQYMIHFSDVFSMSKL